MIKLRAILTHPSRRRLALALLGSLCAAVLLAHGAIGMGHDVEMSPGESHPTEDALSVCLAITEIAAVAFLISILITPILRSRRPARSGALLRSHDLHRRRSARSARASPAMLQVFRS